MTIEELPANLRSLADPAQEVLLDRRPAVRLLAPVPLHRLGAESLATGDPYRPGDIDQRL